MENFIAFDLEGRFDLIILIWAPWTRFSYELNLYHLGMYLMEKLSILLNFKTMLLVLIF